MLLVQASRLVALLDISLGHDMITTNVVTLNLDHATLA